MTETPNPARDYPDKEIEHCLSSYGGWYGWLGEFAGEAVRAIAWKASQGDELPEDLHRIRDAIAQFGYAPIEEAVARVQGLEKACREVSELLDRGSGCSPDDVESAREIVDSCVKFSGGFGDEEEAGDA